MTSSEETTTGQRAGAIDWNEVHRRLEAAQAALAPGAALAPDEKKKILRARAKALARPPEPQAAAEASFEVLEFLLAHERYALESRWVREIVQLKELTPVPCTPRFVLGIVNVRGRILSVIDLKKLFDLPDKGLTDLNKLIILHSATPAPPAQASGGEGMEFGILADAIRGVRRVASGELQPSLPTLTGIREEFLKGVTAEPVVILDGAKLLGNRDMIVQEEVGA